MKATPIIKRQKPIKWVRRKVAVCPYTGNELDPVFDYRIHAMTWVCPCESCRRIWRAE